MRYKKNKGMIDSSKMIGLNENILKQYIGMKYNKVNLENLTIRSYEVIDNQIHLKYSENTITIDSNNKKVTRSFYGGFFISIVDYISFVHLYTLEQVEERISQIGNGYII